MFNGVLFDMDGVLVDSEELICKAAISMFAEHGCTMQDDDFLPFIGTGENTAIGGVAKKYGLQIDVEAAKLRTYAIYESMAKEHLKALPGALDFIEYCKFEGIKVAVATSADRSKLLVNLAAMGLCEMDFDTIVSGSEVEHKKPAPDIYLLAAEKLNLHPAQCLVVEDAISGIAAAKAAGAKCLALTTSFEAQHLVEADWICADLSCIPSETFSFLAPL